MTRRQAARLPFAALLALAPYAAAQAPETGAAEAAAALGEAPIARLLDQLGPDVALYDMHITTLANPFFEGRGATTQGNERAAEYIRFHFEKMGLTPAFSEVGKAADGTEIITRHASFMQRFDPAEVRGQRTPRTAKILSSETGVRVGEGAWAQLIPDLDYAVLGCSGSGEAEGELVFVGYSIAAGADGYLSFPPGTDLTGKIAVAFRFEPVGEDGTSKWTDNEGWSYNASLEPKISAAARRGASGMIIVNPPGVKDERADRLATLGETNTGEFEIPVIMLSQERADFLLSKADPEHRSLLDLRKVADDDPQIIEMPGATVRIRTELERLSDSTPNVGGLLQGRGDLADEIIVIGAHFDHAGYGEYGGRVRGQIHPGADDNGSGTSAMLLAAQRLSERYAEMPEDADARSILFIGFSAEEWGLLGSRYYCENPIAPIEDHVFMINMDMVGRVTNNVLHYGGENSAEGLSSRIQPFVDAAGFDIQPLPRGVFGRSDHASFFNKDVPCLFFFSGFHDVYHAPGDVSMLINRVGAVRVSTLAQNIAVDIATSEGRPVFVDDSGSGASRAAAAPPQVRPAGGRVRFGVQPGSYDSSGGILIERVFPGTSAAEAGLDAGDVITAWNGVAIGGVEDWMPMLAEAKPGDEVKITYTRAGEEHQTTATLKAADG